MDSPTNSSSKCDINVEDRNGLYEGSIKAADL